MVIHVHVLLKCLIFISANSKKLRQRPVSDAECHMPKEPDEFFYYEKLYSENEDEIKSNLSNSIILEVNYQF